MSMPSLKHPCGYPSIRVLAQSIHRTELIAWHYGKKDSPTYKKEIADCPECGEKLPVK
jgi:hypothetical protein